jgi:uncharacterized protein
MRLICKQIGGSYAYGLNTPQSDMDYRGIFLHEDPKFILGMGCNVASHEHYTRQNEQTDEAYKEFRNAMRLLRGANTEMVELLYADLWVTISPEWHLVRSFKHKLVDSEKLYKCLLGYMQGELRLANGERTGRLGGKRKNAIDEYGYSAKNFIQLLRLAWCGAVYFEKGYFPVNIQKENRLFAEHLLNIKTKPENYTKGELNSWAKAAEENLSIAFEKRQFDTKFDEDLANELIYEIYFKVLKNHFKG